VSAVEPTYRLTGRAVDTGFLELPWEQALDEWESPNLVDLERGIGRHVVRFIELGGAYYALKELPGTLAQHEYRVLGHLEGTSVPTVEPIAVVTERTSKSGGELEAILVTRYLEYSLPFRTVLARGLLPEPESVLLDALGGLLVRVHLAGFFWGDCSLSNALFRRDAGALTAYVVDVETGELHERLSDGQRRHDIDLAYENIAYDLEDVRAQLELPESNDAEQLAQDVIFAYERLWADVTSEEVFPAWDTSRLEARLDELHHLGFEIEEIDLAKVGDEYRLKVPGGRVEAGYARRRLLRLTGLDAQENQARRLLADIDAFRAWLVREGEEPISDAALAGRWLSEAFEPAVAAIPPELRGKRAPAEIFHELLDHRWYMSERAGTEVTMPAAIADYVATVLPERPDERTAFLES
jgi:tRNA A-37 threonylcarbamoyl transferase component Bud32